MRRPALAALIVAAVSAVTSAQAPQSATESLVTIPVSVTTADDKMVAGLLPSDFVVSIDDAPVAVTRAEQTGESLDAVLMLDRSRNTVGGRWLVLGSMSTDNLMSPLIKDFGHDIVPALRPEDRVRFGQVSGAVTIGPVLVNTASAFQTAMRMLPPVPEFASSPIWDGVVAAATRLATEPGRRVVVLITDGHAKANLYGLNEAAKEAAGSQVVVSVVDEHDSRANVSNIKQDKAETVELHPENTLKKLAAMTGGVYLADATALGKLSRFQEMAKLVARALVDRQRAYSVIVRAPADGALHALTVGMTRPNIQVRAPAFIKAGS